MKHIHLIYLCIIYEAIAIIKNYGNSSVWEGKKKQKRKKKYF